MGDVTGVAAVANELNSRYEAFASYNLKITQLADDFDFDGIMRVVEELEKLAGSDNP